jgi:hypothetical protein
MAKGRMKKPLNNDNLMTASLAREMYWLNSTNSKPVPFLRLYLALEAPSCILLKLRASQDSSFCTGRTYGKLYGSEGSHESSTKMICVSKYTWCSDGTIETTDFGSTKSIAWKIIPLRNNIPKQPGIIPGMQVGICLPFLKQKCTRQSCLLHNIYDFNSQTVRISTLAKCVDVCHPSCP